MFNKKIKEQINTLQATVSELKETVITNELNRLREINKKYNELNDDIKNIHLDVKSVRHVEDDCGSLYLEISYKIPVLKIPFNADGKITRNEFFRSANRLNLLSQKDMDKISAVLSDAEQKIKNN